MKQVNNYDLDKLKGGIFLAIRGGGIRSCSAIGIIKALEESEIPIKGVSGESMSSIVASLLAYGYKAEEIIELFKKYNQMFTKAAKIYGGKGSIVIEEEVNRVTDNITFKDLKTDCYINACYGRLLHPLLFLYDKTHTPDETLGSASRSSASLPIFYGNHEKDFNYQHYSLFDGGALYNPYIPQTDLPIVFASFHNYVDYYYAIPQLRKTIEASKHRADLTIDAPIKGVFITGSNEDMQKAYDRGYEEAKRVLKL